jgi:hypothetical protein
VGRDDGREGGSDDEKESGRKGGKYLHDFVQFRAVGVFICFNFKSCITK